MSLTMTAALVPNTFVTVVQFRKSVVDSTRLVQPLWPRKLKRKLPSDSTGKLSRGSNAFTESIILRQAAMRALKSMPLPPS